MNYMELKISKENMCSVGIDNITGLYYLCVPSGFADIPAYYPITTAEYKDFEIIDYKAIIYITNRCIIEIDKNKYKLQWASKYNHIYAIIEKVNDDFWKYEICNTEKPKIGSYKWDELIIVVYSEIAELQKSKKHL